MLQPVYPQGVDKAALERFCARMHYQAIPPGDDAAYLRLQQALEGNADFQHNMVYYMAVRPAEFPAIIGKLGGVGLLKEKNGWRRVVIENHSATICCAHRLCREACTSI